MPVHLQKVLNVRELPQYSLIITTENIILHQMTARYMHIFNRYCTVPMCYALREISILTVFTSAYQLDGKSWLGYFLLLASTESKMEIILSRKRLRKK